MVERHNSHAGGTCRLVLRNSRSSWSADPWEQQFDGGAGSGRAVDTRVAADLPHAAIDLGQSQSGAAVALRGEERLENLVGDFGGDTRTVVGHPNRNIRPSLL